MQKKLEEMKHFLQYETDSENDEIDNEEEMLIDESENVNCDCNICKIFDEIDDKWLLWNPIDVLEIKIKEYIDNTQTHFDS
jgi:hypothetical protein